MTSILQLVRKNVNEKHRQTQVYHSCVFYIFIESISVVIMTIRLMSCGLINVTSCNNIVTFGLVYFTVGNGIFYILPLPQNCNGYTKKKTI